MADSVESTGFVVSGGGGFPYLVIADAEGNVLDYYFDIEAEVAAADEARAAESLSGAQVSVFYLPLHLTRIMLTI